MSNLRKIGMVMLVFAIGCFIYSRVANDPSFMSMFWLFTLLFGMVVSYDYIKDSDNKTIKSIVIVGYLLIFIMVLWVVVRGVFFK